MRRDAVEEPTVVGNDHGTSGKILETFLKRADGVYVHVVGRLVEKEHVTLVFERERKMQTVSLAAGEDSAELFLICTGEIESRNISPCRHFPLAEFHEVGVFGDCLVDSLVRVYALVLLVNVGEFHGVSDDNISGIWLLQTHDETEQGRLAGSVRTYNADYSRRRERERKVLEQKPVAVGLGHRETQ